MYKKTAPALFLAALALTAAPPIPRPAPELAIHEISGKQSKLSILRGNVVVLQFLYTTCGHCANTARMLEGIQKDLGPKTSEVANAMKTYNPDRTWAAADAGSGKR